MKTTTKLVLCAVAFATSMASNTAKADYGKSGRVMQIKANGTCVAAKLEGAGANEWVIVKGSRPAASLRRDFYNALQTGYLSGRKVNVTFTGNQVSCNFGTDAGVAHKGYAIKDIALL